jgi:hypothetical protein
VRKARKRLHRLALRRRIRCVGMVCRKRGRPELVYARWSPKNDQLLHEVELTSLCFRLDVGAIRRGPVLRHHPQRPDAELLLRGVPILLEWDRHTMTTTQIEARYRLYESCPHLSLWVCPSVERMEQLRGLGQRLRATALWTTHAQALADPYGCIWMDAQGQLASLPREQRGL